MDRSEYRTKLDEVQKLISEGNEEEAFFILDSMNWRKVRNVNALLTAGEIYEERERYAEAKELLELAHERSPIGRMIIYRLALLCIRLDSFDEAADYYEEFVEIAPHDSLQYIIQYELAKAKGQDDITLISILEELKEHDFLEEWAYELALLYHKSGQVEKCITTCDEIILWYGEGPYVESALELKMIYQPLNEQQEHKYRSFRQSKDGITEVTPGLGSTRGGEILKAPIEIPEVAVNTDKFNTVNLQAEIKKNIEEIMNASKRETVSESLEGIRELVEEIPFVKDPPQDTGPLEEISQKKEESKRIDDTLKLHFEQYLAEEYDGQISFAVPDYTEVEPQIAGQMTIDQVMADWQKTARAAEAALAEADEQELENAKARAIEQANQIIDRLEDSKEALDAGATPKEVLKQGYDIEPPRQDVRVTYVTGDDYEKFATKRIDPEEIAALERAQEQELEQAAFKSGATFKIPKISAETGETSGIGFEVPIMGALGEVLEAGRNKIDKGNTLAVAAKAGKALRKAAADMDVPEGWQPENLAEPRQPESISESGQLSEATRMVADVNEMLQKEIDKAQSELSSDTQRLPDIKDEMRRITPDETVSQVAAPEYADPEPVEEAVPEVAEPAAEAVPEVAEPISEASEQAAEMSGSTEPGVPQAEFAKEPEIDLSQTRAFAEAVVALMNEQNAKAEQGAVKVQEEEKAKEEELEAEEPAAAETVEEAPETVEVEEPETVEPEADTQQVEEAKPKTEAHFEPIPDPMEDADFAPKVYLIDEPEVDVFVDEDNEAISDEYFVEEDGTQEVTVETEPQAEDGTEDTDIQVDSSDDDLDPDDDLGSEIPYADGEEPDAEELQAGHTQAGESYDEYERYEPSRMDYDSSEGDGEYDFETRYELTEEEKKIFSYFTPIAGMERSLCRALNGARKKLLSDNNELTGNIIIQGSEGSGKTTLATSVIQVLQHETGKPSGNVGRIDGEKLNTKDIAKLFAKIKGGCLIIEHAGDITRETALELSAQMSQDLTGILVILEDARMGVERAMALHPMFSKKFTEKIVIPLLTIDELVNFGKAYAEGIGYSIDELGLLAMYDRINLIQRYDHPTNLGEVKEIVDEAIDIAESGGLKGFLGRIRGRSYDEAGNIILQEKDFQGR